MPMENYLPAVLVELDQWITPTEVGVQMDETCGHVYWCEGDHWRFWSFDVHNDLPAALRSKPTGCVVFSSYPIRTARLVPGELPLNERANFNAVLG